LARGEIKGLTTAASIWTVAAIRLAVGGGHYFAAGTSTAVILIILAGVKPIEAAYRVRNQSCHLVVEAHEARWQKIYRCPKQPMSRRMGAAIEALPHEHPRLGLSPSTECMTMTLRRCWIKRSSVRGGTRVIRSRSRRRYKFLRMARTKTTTETKAAGRWLAALLRAGIVPSRSSVETGDQTFHAKRLSQEA
jgi:MgtC family